MFSFNQIISLLIGRFSVFQLQTPIIFNILILRCKKYIIISINPVILYC